MAFPELIVQDNDQSFQLALTLARQPGKLRDIKQRLIAARLKSPVFDTVRFNLERLFEGVWAQQAIEKGQRHPVVVGTKAEAQLQTSS